MAGEEISFGLALVEPSVITVENVQKEAHTRKGAGCIVSLCYGLEMSQFCSHLDFPNHTDTCSLPIPSVG